MRHAKIKQCISDHGAEFVLNIGGKLITQVIIQQVLFKKEAFIMLPI